jgi:hypothetical protein
MKRRMAIGLMAATVAAAAIIPLPAMARDRIEEPAFEVVSRHSEFELRRYAPRIEAVVVVRARNAREASNAGFRVLADYIFGNNLSREGIEMTAPVGRSQTIEMTAPVGRSQRGDTWTISFTMPSKWTMKTLPRPVNERVELREVPQQHYVVSAFRGSPGERTVAEREKALRVAAAEAGLSVRSEPAIYNRFDPPWVPPILRRNELWVAVDPAPGASR